MRSRRSDAQRMRSRRGDALAPGYLHAGRAVRSGEGRWGPDSKVSPGSTWRAHRGTAEPRLPRTLGVAPACYGSWGVLSTSHVNKSASGHWPRVCCAQRHLRAPGQEGQASGCRRKEERWRRGLEAGDWRALRCACSPTGVTWQESLQMGHGAALPGETRTRASRFLLKNCLQFLNLQGGSSTHTRPHSPVPNTFVTGPSGREASGYDQVCPSGRCRA